jgi:hypothetical protein
MSFINATLLFLFLGIANAFCQVNENFLESYVWLRISKTRGNTFYRIQANKNETPYVNLRELLTSYLDFAKVNCNTDEKICTALLPPRDNLRYWVDFKNLKCGNDSTKEFYTFKEDNILFLENEYWMDYEILNHCFPVQSLWDYKLYYLSISPNYPLVEDQLSSRKLARNFSYLEKARKEEISKRLPIKPKDNFRAHGRYNLTYQEPPAKNTSALRKFNYDLNADILGGTLKTGGNIVKQQDTQQDLTQYLTYSLRDQKYFKALDVGDVFLATGNGLISDTNGDKGIKLESRQRDIGAGIASTVQGQTIPGTDVELYRNGTIIGNMLVLPDGIYKFENVYSAGGDNLVLKFFFTDGSNTEKTIRVADDGGLLLEKKQSEYRFYSAEQLDSRFNYLNYRYGIHNKSSLGLQAAMFSNIRNSRNVDTKDLERPILIPELVTFPFKSMNFYIESVVGQDQLDWSGRTNLTLLDPHFFSFQYKQIEADSPLLGFRNTVAGTSTNIGHSVNFWRFQLSDVYEKSNFSEKVTFNLITSLTTDFSIIGQGFKEQISGSSEQKQANFGGRLRLSNFADILLSRQWLQPQGSNNAELNLRTSPENPWGGKLTTQCPDSGKCIYNADFSYRFNRVYTTSLLASNDLIGFELRITDVISQSPGPKYIEEYGTGTVSGLVQTPKNNEGKSQGLSGVIVTVDGRSTTTNENGYFQLSGISPNRNVEIKIDSMSLDVNYAPKVESEVLYFRPGTHIEYYPEIVNTVGLDGFITIKQKEVNTKYSLHVRRPQSETLLQTIEIEDDGFYILEGLSPGEYLFELIGSSHPEIVIRAKTVKIDAGSEWIKDYNWIID